MTKQEKEEFRNKILSEIEEAREDLKKDGIITLPIQSLSIKYGKIKKHDKF